MCLQRKGFMHIEISVQRRVAGIAQRMKNGLQFTRSFAFSTEFWITLIIYE